MSELRKQLERNSEIMEMERRVFEAMKASIEDSRPPEPQPSLLAELLRPFIAPLSR